MYVLVNTYVSWGKSNPDNTRVCIVQYIHFADSESFRIHIRFFPLYPSQPGITYFLESIGWLTTSSVIHSLFKKKEKKPNQKKKSAKR